MKGLILILMFIVVGALMVVSNNGLAMSNPENVEEFRGYFVEWVDHLYSNIQVLTGAVIRLDWMPGNFSR